MKPKLMMMVTPDEHSDYAVLLLEISVEGQDGPPKRGILYNQVRLVQGLGEDQLVIPWALAAFSDHASAITSALSHMMTSGQADVLLEEPDREMLF